MNFCYAHAPWFSVALIAGLCLVAYDANRWREQWSMGVFGMIGWCLALPACFGISLFCLKLLTMF